ncbi:hypothetical protein DFH94DRAFT_169769 [Russula ochroleuca]|uniref:Uncharacterized protein n=1 Tax=Russula ochroleuca TaxID=152965 RepID=A0A9P5N482_9AGAM|nr:hypothetical protein DFH94DRAFT_169769 [Russula ochroleuca]
MIVRAEAVQAWLENVTYQTYDMSYKEQVTNLASQIPCLKMYDTRCVQDTERDFWGARHHADGNRRFYRTTSCLLILMGCGVAFAKLSSLRSVLSDGHL